jgi:hypothetical protein
MRVDVEVYKGPLSKEPEVQIGELCGIVQELDKALEEYHNSLYVAMLDVSKGRFKTTEQLRTEARKCDPKDPPDGNCERETGAHIGADRYRCSRKALSQCWCDAAWTDRLDSENLSCTVLATLHDNTEDLRDQVRSLLRSDQSLDICTPRCSGFKGLVTDREQDQPIYVEPAVRDEVAKLSALAMQLKLKSMLRAEADAVFRPRSNLVRIMGAGFTNLASEYSNQIASRADALLKQTNQLARFLPQSVHLRDSQPTEFVNLYVWNRAASAALMRDFLFHPIDSVTTEESANRVRSIERLFADAYWSTINTVYASGQGDVSMALVKDDIGNWNLKSFSNDPSELLKAYKAGGLALIKTAAELAAKPAGIDRAQQILGFANRLALGQRAGEGAADRPDEVIESVRAVARERLLRVKTELASAEKDEEAALQEAKRILADHDEILQVLAERAGRAGSDAPPAGGDPLPEVPTTAPVRPDG